MYQPNTSEAASTSTGSSSGHVTTVYDVDNGPRRSLRIQGQPPSISQPSHLPNPIALQPTRHGIITPGTVPVQPQNPFALPNQSLQSLPFQPAPPEVQQHHQHMLQQQPQVSMHPQPPIQEVQMQQYRPPRRLDFVDQTDSVSHHTTNSNYSHPRNVVVENHHHQRPADTYSIQQHELIDDSSIPSNAFNRTWPLAGPLGNTT